LSFFAAVFEGKESFSKAIWVQLTEKSR